MGLGFERVERLLLRSVPVFIHVAAAAPGALPFSCRGYGAILKPDDAVLRVSMLRSQWERMRGQVQPGRTIAALLTSGVDNESYQAKGRWLATSELETADVEALQRQRRITSIYLPSLAPLLQVSPAECVAVDIAVDGVYVQTPGPDAGALLEQGGSK